MPRTFDRRRFLELGAVSAGLALGCGDRGSRSATRSSGPPMPTRPLGSTGLEVSEIAFGAHGVDNAELMAAAFEAGITTFCTSGSYLDGLEELNVGETLHRLGVPRERVVIVTGNPPKQDDTVEKVLADVDASLKRLRTDSIDVYCNAMVQTPEEVRSEAVLEAFERARAAGKVRHLALSGHHGGMQACLEAGIEAGLYEVFFIKYDFVSYPDEDEILQRAAQRGIGTIAFKVDAGRRVHEVEDLEAGGLSFRQAALKWALGNASVASVAVTVRSFDDLAEFTGAVGSRLSSAEVAMLRRYADEMRHRYCRFCGTCEACCPHGVAVADIMRFEMYATCDGRHDEAARLYRGLPHSTTAEPCARCAGLCDAACPFGRRVRTGLLEAHRSLQSRRA